MRFKRKILMAALASAWMFFSLGLAAAQENSSLPLSPQPRLLERRGGEFTLPPVVAVESDAAAINSLAMRQLERFLAEAGTTVSKTAALKVQLRLIGESARTARRLPARREGYLLSLEQALDGGGRILIEGNDETGLFYGVQTLRQLLGAGKTENLTIEDYPDIASRGVVEGFYGVPWSHAQRMKHLEFLGRHKLNLYIYAPKDDPYHRAKWRQPYPKEDMRRLKELIQAADANAVEFVFALSPGLDLHFGGRCGAADDLAMLRKLESLYAMGVRRFAVFYDDIADKSGKEQAASLNRLVQNFIAAKPDARPLLTVPTEYFSADMLRDGGAKPYTADFSGALAASVLVMYTGPGVVCERIDKADIAAVSGVYGRKMAVWWNYPVSDFMPEKLALGPVSGLAADLGEYMEMLAVNPMEHAALSEIAVQTAAEYAWSPPRYDEEAAWRRALNMQYGELAADMALFASHSSRMENSWAKAGRPDAPRLRRQMDLLWRALRAKEDISPLTADLYASFDRMESAARRLRAQLPQSVLRECAPQLKIFQKIAAADRTALQMLEAARRGDWKQYDRLRKITLKNQRKIAGARAKISERTAAAFIEEALAFSFTRP